MQIKSLIKDVNTTNYHNWFDKNNLEKVLAIIDSNKFNHKKKEKENLNTLTLKTWLIILKVIQLMKQMLKRI